MALLPIVTRRSTLSTHQAIATIVTLAVLVLPWPLVYLIPGEANAAQSRAPDEQLSADEAKLSGKLVVTVDDDNVNHKLAIVQADGTGFRLLDGPKDFNHFADVASDGTRLVYMSADRNAGRGPSYVKTYVAQSDGSEPARIADSLGFPRWSPDGQRLLATRIQIVGERSGSLPGSELEFRQQILDLDGSMQADLGLGVNGFWAPSGKQIGYFQVAKKEGEFFLYDLTIVDLDMTQHRPRATKQTRITQTAEGVGIRALGSAAWSSDGSSIAVCRLEDIDGHAQPVLAMLDLEARHLRRVAILDDDCCEMSAICFSPDGKWLAAAFDEGGNGRVYALSLDGQTRVPITPADRSCWFPAWSR